MACVKEKITKSDERIESNAENYKGIKIIKTELLRLEFRNKMFQN
jgi:hypothetical protein